MLSEFKQMILAAVTLSDSYDAKHDKGSSEGSQQVQRVSRGAASQKVMEGQACPHETLKIVHDCKRLMTEWWASQHTVLYYYSLNN